MDYRGLLNEARLTRNEAISGGFVRYPDFLLQGLSAEQLQWQQLVYQRALAQARAAVAPREFVFELTPEMKN